MNQTTTKMSMEKSVSAATTLSREMWKQSEIKTQIDVLAGMITVLNVVCVCVSLIDVGMWTSAHNVLVDLYISSVRCVQKLEMGLCKLNIEVWIVVALWITLNHHSVKYLNWLRNMLNDIHPNGFGFVTRTCQLTLKKAKCRSIYLC